VRADKRYGSPIHSAGLLGKTRGSAIPGPATRPTAGPSPLATRPKSPSRNYGKGPIGRKLVKPTTTKSVRPSNSSPAKPGTIRPLAKPRPLVGTKLGNGLRGGVRPGTSGVRPSGYTGTGSPRPSAGSSLIRPSSYWGGYASSNYAPYSNSYGSYYPSYTHCSPWSLGYYGSHFSLSFGGFFYPYGYYYDSYWNDCPSYWSPFNYSYCLPSYYSVVYVTQSIDQEYDAPPGSNVAPVAPAPLITPAPLAPQSKPLDAGADRYISLGDAAFSEGRYTDSIQLYAKAIELAPGEASLYLVLSDALFAAGDYHYAAYVVRKALELDPQLAQTQVDKHSFYSDPRLLDQQLAALENYLVQRPTDRDARLVLALNNLFSGRPAAAVDLLESPTASGLESDAAAGLILDAARRIQHGPVAE